MRIELRNYPEVRMNPNSLSRPVHALGLLCPEDIIVSFYPAKA